MKKFHDMTTMNATKPMEKIPVTNDMAIAQGRPSSILKCRRSPSSCSLSVIWIAMVLLASSTTFFVNAFMTNSRHYKIREIQDTTFKRIDMPTARSTQQQTATTRSTIILYMGKLRNRQAELQKKMALAKKQNKSTGEQQLSEEEIEEMNDRKRFDELLSSSQAISGNIVDGDYLSSTQEEEIIDAYRRGVDRLFEGDPAPTQVFEELVSIKSENAIGETGAKRLVPWLRKSATADVEDNYLVVVCDPRVKSPEFHNTIKSLHTELSKDVAGKVIFINADTPAENRRFLKKNNLIESGIRLYSDEKREWMQAYTALGENRWSMTLFVLADERIQRLVREYANVSSASVLENAIDAMKKRKL